MSGDAARDLDEWMPRLIAVWRRRRRAPRVPPPRHGGRGRGLADDGLPDDELTREELKEISASVRTLSLGQ